MTRVLAAHGTKDPRGQATIEAIRAAVAERVGDVRIAWLDVLEPTLDEVLADVARASVDGPIDVVPLLLSEGFHIHEDLPGEVPIGDDPRLIDALADRLTDAGWAGESVVLGATGSARDSWHALAQRVAAGLGERLGVDVQLGVLSGPGIDVTEQLTRSRGNVAVAAYLLAEGFFERRLRAYAAANPRVTAVSAPIGAHPAVIDLLVERFGGSDKNVTMATTAFKGNPVQTVGDLPSQGNAAPDFTVTGTDLSDISLSDLSGKRVVLNIFPSVDTGVCAASVRRFNELAAGLDNTTVLNVSADLPFALGRFCGAEGIENVQSGSVFKSSFGADYGVTMSDGPLQGLLARSVVVIDADGKVVHTELVPEIGQEPDYDAATGALS